MAAFKRFPTLADAQEAAEAVAILYAAANGIAYTPTGMAPTSYGPGRQPMPPEAFYQRYWVAPLEAVAANAPFGIPTALPSRIEPDAFALTLNDAQVDLRSKTKRITLNFRGLE